MQRLLSMRNMVMDYSWGRPGGLDHYFHREFFPQGPQAELWMGTHHHACSQVEEGFVWQDLDLWLRELGAKPLDFLFKVITIHSALSIQVHPTSQQASEGYALEKKSIHSSESRHFVDPHSKPELIYALEPFRLMVGLRSFEEIKKNLTLLSHPFWKRLINLMDSGDQKIVDYRSLLLSIHHEESLDESLLQSTLHDLQKIAHPLFPWFQQLKQDYPGDPGIFYPLFLNTRELKVGEALFIDAGCIHSYVSGLGLELMGNSDNVVRAALTAKKKDLRFFLQLAKLEATKPHDIMPKETILENVKSFLEPQSGLCLHHAVFSPRDVAALSFQGPAIILVTKGKMALKLKSDEEVQTMAPGESLFFWSGSDDSSTVHFEALGAHEAEVFWASRIASEGVNE